MMSLSEQDNTSLINDMKEKEEMPSENKSDEKQPNKPPPKQPVIENEESNLSIREMDLSVELELELAGVIGQRPRDISDITCTHLAELEWLGIAHINYFLRDLKQKFPAIQGLENPNFYALRTGNYLPGFNDELFIQIIVVNSNHWICISNYKCAPNEINIYDSMATFNTQDKFDQNVGLKQIIKNMKPLCRVVYIKNVQRQSARSGNCGLFSIAFAQLVANDLDPTQCRFNEKNLRSHFNTCVVNSNISFFPHSYRHLTNDSNFNILYIS
jgi:hypothetical protein